MPNKHDPNYVMAAMVAYMARLEHSLKFTLDLLEKGDRDSAIYFIKKTLERPSVVLENDGRLDVRN